MSVDVGLDELVLRLRRMMRTSSRHHVLVARFSRIAFIRNDSAQRLAQLKGVKELAAYYGGECLVTGGADAVLIFPENMDAVIAAVATRIGASLFPNRPAAERVDDAVTTVYRVPEDYAELRAVVAEFHPDIKTTVPTENADASSLEGPVTPKRLARIVDVLRSLDLRRFVRYGTVARISADGRRRIEYIRLNADLVAVRMEQFPRIEPFEHLYLGQELRNHIDFDLLEFAAKRRNEFSGMRVGLGLAPKTVLDPRFGEFTHALGEANVALTVEMTARALMEEPTVGMRAIAAARHHEHAVCVDDVSLNVLPFVRLDAFGADYYSVTAAREHFALFADPSIVGTLRRLGKQVILNVGENRGVVPVGRALGIECFQEDQSERRLKAA